MSVNHAESAVIESVEAASGLSFHACAPDHVVEALGLEQGTLAGATLTLARRSENLYFSRALGVGLPRPASEAHLRDLLEWYRVRQVRRFSLDLSPLARPPKLAHWLARAGFRERQGAAKLFRDAEPIESPDTPFRVEEIGPEDSLGWFRVIAATWTAMRSRSDWFRARVGWPGWRHYIAYERNHAVAAASMFLRGEAARLCEAATLSAHRRRGAQSALIAHRIQDGLSSGVRVFTSETAPPLPRMSLVSYSNMERAGFRLGYIRPTFTYDARGRASS